MTNNNLQDERELLPCPFCGGEAETDSHRSYRNITTGHMGRAVSVYCLKCNVENMICCEDQPEDSPEDLLAHLIEQWNTRAAQAEPVWVPCTPELLKQGVSCDATPRRAGAHHSHDHALYTRPAPSAVVEALRKCLAVLEEWDGTCTEDIAATFYANDEIEQARKALALIPPEAEQPATDESERHIANEWADAACNGLDWLRNVRNVPENVDWAIADMEENIARIRAIGAEQPAAKNEAQALDEQAKDVREWRGLSNDERDLLVGELVECGTEFVAPLYSIIEKVEATLLVRNAERAKRGG